MKTTSLKNKKETPSGEDVSQWSIAELINPMIEQYPLTVNPVSGDDYFWFRHHDARHYDE